MDTALNNLRNLSKAKHLVPAEQVLMIRVNELNQNIGQSLQEDTLVELEGILLSLLTLNNGTISIQCSIHIASTLLKIYSQMKKPQIWGILNIAVDKPSTSTFVAAGYICKHIGHGFKAQLPRFVDTILKSGTNHFASFYALNCVFKAGGNTLQSYIEKVLNYIKLILPTANQPNTIMGLKLLKNLIKYNAVGKDGNQIITLGIAKIALKNTSPFIVNSVATLIASYVFVPFQTEVLAEQNNASEWVIDTNHSQNDSEGLKAAFKIFAEFPQIITQIIDEFLKLLGNDLVSSNYQILFNYIRTNSHQSLSNLIRMLPQDQKFILIRSVLHEEASNDRMEILLMLCSDDGSFDDALTLAVHEISHPQSSISRGSIEFLRKIAFTHPQSTNIAIKSAIDFSLNDKNSPEDIRGKVIALHIIISNLSRPSTVIDQYKDKLSAIVSKFFTTQAMNILPGLSLLSCLDDRLLSENIIQTLKEKCDSICESKLTAQHEPTIQGLFMVFSRYPQIEGAENLIKAVIRQQYEPSKPTLFLPPFLKVAPRVLAGKPELLKIARHVYQIIKKIPIPQSVIKKNLTRPLPVSLDILGSAQEENWRVNEFFDSAFDSFPQIQRALQQKDREAFVREALEDKEHNAVSIFILAKISADPQLSKDIPPTILSTLLTIANRKGSEPLAQPVAECIGCYVSNHQEAVGKIFRFIDSHMSVSSTLVLESLFTHISIPNNFISRAIVYLDCQMKNSSEMQFAVHALSTIIITHAMQVASLGITTNQFGVLFNALHTPQSTFQMVLYMCYELFRCLVETVSYDITAGSALEPLIAIILRSFEFTPTSYGRQIYYECSCAVYTFAHKLKNLAPISFPKSPRTPYSTSLSACNAFSYLMKFDRLEFDVKEIVPILLKLLQATRDERAASFIQSIALLADQGNLSFWISTVRRVLISGSLLEGVLPAIEPIPEVKKCLLSVCSHFARLLSEMPFLNTEFLDDFISAVCRATETDRVALQEEAFPVLQLAIECFKERTADEGGRLLDLYDSQFSLAVKVGFQLPLDVSGGFLSTYLSFTTANMDTDPESCSAILVVYLSGLKACVQRSTAYFQLATHLCTVARTYQAICDLISPFLKKLTPIFADIVLQAMKLYESTNDWRAMTAFRTLALPFYGELLPAFVWLQFVSSNIIIDVNVLVSFFVIELLHGKERWMSMAAFNALVVAINCFGNDIKPDLWKVAITCAESHSSEEAFRELLHSCAVIVKADEKFDELRKAILTYCLGEHFSPSILAYILKSDERRTVSVYSLEIFRAILGRLLSDALDGETAGALVTMLISHTPTVSGFIVEAATALDGKHLDFALTVIGRAVCSGSDAVPLEKLSRFCIARFRKGGMQLIARILINRPEVGVALVANGGAKAAFILAAKDTKNARAYLLFVSLVLEKAPEIAPHCVHLAAVVASKLRPDNALDRKLFQVAARIVRACEAVCDLEKVFNALSSDLRNPLVEMLDACVNEARQRQRAAQLIEFSTNQRNASKMDWQTLEIDDGSD